MCTVVTRWAPSEPSQILALRDELTGRDFDDPDFWWPQLPDVVGGRDRSAGGTWCASRASTGVTALVLNRPQKRVAEPGAPSRGVLPLLAAEHDAAWVDHVAMKGMASFAVVLVTPARLLSWVYDGEHLSVDEHRPGTHMFTSGGAEDGKAARYLDVFAQKDFPVGWRSLIAATAPADDPAALVVRHEHDGQVFATVFGQLITATAGQLQLDYSREPWSEEPWQRFTAPRPQQS
jgi:hypothetical protein